jgi:hypothetical protein
MSGERTVELLPQRLAPVVDHPERYFGSVYPGDRGSRKKRIIEAGAITLIGQSDFLP